jgi:rod shape-determining protein MreC
VAVIFFQLNNERHSLFTKAKRETPRFLFGLIFSFVLIVADGYYHCANQLRTLLSCITSPLQYASDYPFKLAHLSKSLFFSKQALIEENEQLHHEQLVLKEQLQYLTPMRDENKTLKELLAFSKAAGRYAVGANVLSLDTQYGRHVIVINKGQRDHVMPGLPVLDEHGVVGQVVDVGLMTSTVLMISDAMSAIPIRNNRTGETGILTGVNHANQLSLIHLPKTSLVMQGDLLVTSGLGGRYPEGYPVGRVSDVISTPGDEFIKVHVTPLAALERSRLVLLIWPDKEQYALSAEVDERLHRARLIS